METIVNKDYKKNLSKNFIYSLVFEVINLFATFFTRYIFIHQLGNSYLSINGLFQNIVGIISFADLGIGTVMTFFLYENIVKNDQKKINLLLKFYNIIYTSIAAFIFLVGMATMPFLPLLIDDSINIQNNVYIIFFLFVLNTSLSYVFCSNKTFLIANQKSYIVNILTHGFHAVLSLFQIFILIFFRNYYLYLILQVSFTLLSNIIIFFYSRHKYGFLKDKCPGSLPKGERKRFWKQTRDILIYKLGATLVNSTDNILISVLVMSSAVGLTSNYLLIINSINAILMAICNSFIGTIGIICASDDDVKNKFFELNLFCNTMFTFSSVCLFALSTPFVSMLFGETYILDDSVIFFMVLSFLLTGLNQISSLFRSSFGMFREGRLIPLSCGVINIGLSLLFGKLLGLVGIYIATCVSKLLTFSIFDPILVFKKRFGLSSVKKYFAEFFFLVLTTVILMFFIKEIVWQINIKNAFADFLTSAIVCVVFTCFFSAAAMSFLPESGTVYDKISNIIEKPFSYFKAKKSRTE